MYARNPSGRGGRGGRESPTAFSRTRSSLHLYSTPSSLKNLLAEGPDEPSPISPRLSVFHRVRVATSALRAWRSSSTYDPATAPAEKRIVVYFTSLRVVRKTFEDCRDVRSILRGFRIAFDERDVSMDSRLLEELKGILRRREVSLPAVFVGGRFLGGAEEIRLLHESGDLKWRLEGAPPASLGNCQRCVGVGFVLCQNCDGSRKFFSNKGGGFRSCSLCNENGLVRCVECLRSEIV